jgi:adenylate cyclase
MAVFGVPFAHPDDAIHACNTALKMKESLDVWNKERIAQGQNPLAIGIGINTGNVSIR